MFALGVVVGAVVFLAAVAVRVKARTKCSWKDALTVALGGGGPGAPDR
jgi:hypothetical protein